MIGLGDEGLFYQHVCEACDLRHKSRSAINDRLNSMMICRQLLWEPLCY